MHKLTIHDNIIELIRDSKEFSHKMLFILDKKVNTEYYIKEYKSTITIPIITTKMIISENNIELHYIICDSENKYIYKLEMSEE